MAITVTTTVQPLAADHTNVGKVVVADIAFDSSYPTGGEAFDKGALGLSEVWFVALDLTAPDDAGLLLRYDYATDKIIAFWVDTSVDGAPLAEVGDETDLSTYVARAFVYGLSS